MKVFAFVGPSGSGKSYRATWVANEAGMECIIDDGLLIRGNELLSGYSAKKEPTKIGSIPGVRCSATRNMRRGCARRFYGISRKVF